MDLDDATTQYRQAESALADARAAVITAMIDALRGGETPTEVAARSPFTAAYVRRLAREHGVPPAPPGPKRRRG